MKRVFLLIVILGMCLLVTVGGTMTFLNSNSVLKYDAQYVAENIQRNLHVAVDLQNSRIFLVSKGKVIKSYEAEYHSNRSPSPKGEWRIVSKDNIGGELKWLGINMPWAKYGIHGEKEPFFVGIPGGHICVKLKDGDMEELYSLVLKGTPIRILSEETNFANSSFRVLKPGDRGADVYEIQRNLKSRGYFKGYLNGIYNKEMQLAVHEFQRKNGIRESDYIGYGFYIRSGIFKDILIK